MTFAFPGVDSINSWMEICALMTGIAKSSSLNKVDPVYCSMGYWLRLPAVPGTHSCSRPNQTNSHVYIQVQNQKKPQWQLHLHFYFIVSEGSQGDDLFERGFHSPGLFSILLAEAAEMTAVVLVTKMHLHSALTLYQNVQQAFHLSNSLLGTDFSHY